MLTAGAEASGDCQSDQFRHAARLHLAHKVRAVDFYGPGGNIELVGYDLVGMAGDELRQDLAFAFG